MDEPAHCGEGGSLGLGEGDPPKSGEVSGRGAGDVGVSTTSVGEYGGEMCTITL